jgi:hypothetical protein
MIFIVLECATMWIIFVSEPTSYSFRYHFGIQFISYLHSVIESTGIQFLTCKFLYLLANGTG